MDHDALTEWILAMDEAACADLLRAARYGETLCPGGCPRCGTSRFSRVKGRVRVDACRGCGAQLSVTAGTALHGLKLPLKYAVLAAVLITRDGSISTNRLAQILEIPWQTARHLGHRVRVALAEVPPALEPGEVELQGFLYALRRDRGEYPRSRWHGRLFPPRLRAMALVDKRTGALVVRLGSDQAMAVKQLIEAHLPGTEEVPREGTIKIDDLCKLDKVLARTHQRVSRRWLQTYLGALGWCATAPPGPPRALAALRATLAAPRRTWARLRPARLQDDLATYSRFRWPKPDPSKPDPDDDWRPPLYSS